MPDLLQSAGNGIGSPGPRTCTVSMSQPTTVGSLVVVIAAGIHSSYGVWPLYGPSGFTLARVRTVDELTVAVWYRAACPALSSLGVYQTGNGGLQVRVLEYSGVAQANPLDRVAIDGRTTTGPRSGSTGTTGQGDEVVVGLIANAFGSTRQSGFTGGLTQVSESLTAEHLSNGAHDTDDRRNRLTVHQAITTQTGTFSLGATLSTIRDWVAIVLTFKGGTSGPARMTSLTAPRVLATGGRGDLTVFGPLRSTLATAALVTDGSGRIGPFAGQLRLGGWEGLLIGSGTPFRIERVVGLGGADVRTSDGEFPRGDGAQRGVDLQTSRTVLITVNFDGDGEGIEALHAALMAALVPRRDEDLDLLFRRAAGRPLQLLRYRPTQLSDELDPVQMLLRTRSFALLCADPRIYSARSRVVEVPVSPAGSDAVTAASAINTGNARAYPTIRIDNRGTVDVTAIQLVNVTANVSFEIAAVLPPGGQLVGDMPARVTAAPRSVVTLDGQSRYGSWQPPREPFYLAAAPVAAQGVNAVYLRTVPAGAAVKATLEYSDTSAT